MIYCFWAELWYFLASIIAQLLKSWSFPDMGRHFHVLIWAGILCTLPWGMHLQKTSVLAISQNKSLGSMDGCIYIIYQTNKKVLVLASPMGLDPARCWFDHSSSMLIEPQVSKTCSWPVIWNGHGLWLYRKEEPGTSETDADWRHRQMVTFDDRSHTGGLCFSYQGTIRWKPGGPS